MSGKKKGREAGVRERRKKDRGGRKREAGIGEKERETARQVW